jgi:leucyl-tRNA synthetase
MFMGPLEDDKPWTNDGLPGCERFLKRVWTLFHEEDGKIKEQFLKVSTNRELSPEQLLIEQGFHRCLKRVNDSFLNFNFNTAVAAFMEFINIAVENAKAMSRSQALNFVKTLSPFCPHVAAELWQQLGNEGWIDYQSWPELIPAYLEDKNYELVISVNGRPRKRLQVLRGTSAVDLESLAKDTIADTIVGQTIVKVIVVPDKLVNIVVK